MSERSFIETQFPIAQLSAESYRERKAVSGQTLTGLGKWWGRKPLVLVRASILGMLLPASNDPKRDREIFLKLMTMDPDGVWRRRNGNISTREILKRAPDYKDAWRESSKEEREELLEEIWESLSDQDRGDLEASKSFPMDRAQFEALSYDERIKMCLRPEQIDGPDSATWDQINSHLQTSASTLQELIQQLSERRFGHLLRVGDCFSGGGSIPFEAARIGCDAFGSDLSPMAALLTWAGLNLVGGGREVQRKAQEAQESAFAKAIERIRDLGIERSSEGWQAESYLYCLTVTPPGCSYGIPLAPSWVIAEKPRVIAKPTQVVDGAVQLEIVINPTAEDWRNAKSGATATVVSGRVVDPLDRRRSWPIEEIRGPAGLRRWDRSDFEPRATDTFKVKLYCIRWRTHEGSRVYRAPTAHDVENERRVARLLHEVADEWWAEGLLPTGQLDENGEKTSEPIQTRGWTCWHHLFMPRQLYVHGLIAQGFGDKRLDQVIRMLLLNRMADWDSALSVWLPSQGGGIGGGKNTFLNMALNPLYNFSVRPSVSLRSLLLRFPPCSVRPSLVVTSDAREVSQTCDYWLTDPPYADAINYHELAAFFLAWSDQPLRRAFPEWHADGRGALAVRGSGDDFKRSMVEVYSNLTRHMPDNGLQLVMFTHQNPSVWADLGMILWAAGLRVTAAWTVATETPAGGIKKGNYVQGTVLLVLRKRLSEEHGFLDEVYPMVEDEVRRQIDSMRALDEGGEPNFGDTDYQLAAYAAALRVLTQFQTLDGQDIGHELFRAQDNGGRGRNVEKSRFEQVIDRGIEIACDYLIPRGLDNVWRGLTPDERLYLRALDVESRGEHRQGVYQELARGFGVREFRPLLHTSTANSTRVKTPGEFGRKDLTGDGFGGTQLRQLLFAIHTTRSSETPDAGLRFLKDEVANYWGERQRLIAILDWLAELGRGEAMEHWLADSEAARLLAGRLRGDHG